jgi:hypothetical protein
MRYENTTNVITHSSPPRKPNFSPIGSQKRLGSHSSSLSILNN